MSKLDYSAKKIEIKLPSDTFCHNSNPVILMANFKGGKRAEAGMWAQEIIKMLNGIIKSIIALENLMNQIENNSKLYLDNKEIQFSKEEQNRTMIYIIDNGVLRIYACLDKLAQMCRSYFEHEENGGKLEFIKKCGCKETMNEHNCNFGSLVTYLNTIKNRNGTITEALTKLNKNKSIDQLRQHRNGFTHKKNDLDQSTGINPTNVKINENTTTFTFGNQPRSPNEFRIKITDAHNAIIDCINNIEGIIFPKID